MGTFVYNSQRFVITRHSRPVAELIPFRSHNSDRVRVAINSIKGFRKTHSLGDISIREIIEDGRKY